MSNQCHSSSWVSLAVVIAASAFMVIGCDDGSTPTNSTPTTGRQSTPGKALDSAERLKQKIEDHNQKIDDAAGNVFNQ